MSSASSRRKHICGNCGMRTEFLYTHPDFVVQDGVCQECWNEFKQYILENEPLYLKAFRAVRRVIRRFIVAPFMKRPGFYLGGLAVVLAVLSLTGCHTWYYLTHGECDFDCGQNDPPGVRLQNMGKDVQVVTDSNGHPVGYIVSEKKGHK